MDTMPARDATPTYWFVGANYNGNEDQTQRFLDEGIWQNGYETKHLDLVRSMRVGDRIAIKSSYIRKRNLPFDNRGNSVSVMLIKAVGTITENFNDGRRVRVAWTKVDPPREWYFHTHRGTIWRITPGEWAADALVAFTFDGKPQDIDVFRNAPYWRERFGSMSLDRRFGWTAFYAAIADGLLTFRNDRTLLVREIERLSKEVEGLGHLAEDQYADGKTGFIRDICPFTTMGVFNRNIKDKNRQQIARELAKFLKVSEPVPESFEGIPILNNQRSWFFPHERQRSTDHIDALWNVFAAAMKFADDTDDEARAKFAEAFDTANGRPLVAWNLTMGMYWIRPWSFPSLDGNSRDYIQGKLQIQFGRNGPNRRCNSSDYLELSDTLNARFEEEAYPVHSFPDLSLEAWRYDPPKAENFETEEEDNAQPVGKPSPASTAFDEERISMPAPAYSIDDICREGCFIERSELFRIKDVLETKKNLILQGAPGTGKTWLAKRLAYALIGRRDDKQIRAVQFHPNLSYEDFVRGYRPSSKGGLALVDGVFMEAVRDAIKDPMNKFVVVIEEINRGNPAQIFGELLTLLEESKRTPADGLELSYPDTDGVRRPVHVPKNLHVIGTMNIADRSLALVDLALRRRFAFVTLEPRFGETWRNWVIDKCGIDSALVRDIERRIDELNQRIADTIGSQYCVGHSYVTPTRRLDSGTTREWFKQVAETEIAPLLNEYWFDSSKTAKENYDRFIEGW